MTTPFMLRLLLDGLAASLMVAGLAYWWLGNTAHEWMGLGMFALLALHNLLNRRWWCTVARPVRTARNGFDRAWTALLLGGMAVLLVTSVLISQNVFAFMHTGGGFTAKQIHALAAYWVVVLVAVHLGVRWQRVMQSLRSMLKFKPSKARTITLRVLAVLVAAYGLKSSFAMGMGGRLMMQMSLDGWDFESSSDSFFVHWGSIIGLYVFLTHYALAFMKPDDARHPSLRS